MKLALTLLCACALTHCAHRAPEPRLHWHCSLQPDLELDPITHRPISGGLKMHCDQDAVPTVN